MQEEYRRKLATEGLLNLFANVTVAINTLLTMQECEEFVASSIDWTDNTKLYNHLWNRYTEVCKCNATSFFHRLDPDNKAKILHWCFGEDTLSIICVGYNMRAIEDFITCIWSYFGYTTMLELFGDDKERITQVYRKYSDYTCDPMLLWLACTDEQRGKLMQWYRKDH